MSACSYAHPHPHPRNPHARTGASAGVAYFLGEDGKVPEENEDTKKLEQQRIRMKALHTTRDWTTKEDQKLSESVLENHKKLMHADIFRRKSEERRENSWQREEMERIRQLQPHVIESMQQKIAEFQHLETNWVQVAISLNTGRSPVDCKIRWLHSLRLELNKGPVETPPP